MTRQSTVSRKTKETDITVSVNLDGRGQCDISNGIGFFDHMLTALGVHSGMDLTVRAVGDLQVDCHHTVEDTGIVLGQAVAKALGDKSGIARYGTAFIPMDEALGFCSLDVSGRPFLVFNVPFIKAKIGEFDTQMTEEFFRAFAFHSGITLHAKVEYGKNDHHMCEAVFKALAHALKAAVSPKDGTLSTKGALD